MRKSLIFFTVIATAEIILAGVVAQAQPYGYGPGYMMGQGYGPGYGMMNGSAVTDQA